MKYQFDVWRFNFPDKGEIDREPSKMPTTLGPDIRSAPFLLRVVVSITIGCSLVTGWLQTLYEYLVARGAVYVPSWWLWAHLVSLVALLILCFFLRKRDRRLCIIAWCAFWLSLIANIMPGMA